jgi:SAM-dependent methyltransferase
VSRLVQAFLRRYARGQAAAVRPFVAGRRVLDLGAGEGYVGAALRDLDGGWVCSVDVGPFRRAPGPYVVCDGARLPFRAGAFDTTLVLLTLHHCAAPGAVLREAVRVTRGRVVVTESVYRTRRERFWLDLLDHRLNGRRHAGRMPAAVHFKRPGGWARLFERCGLRVAHARWLGSRWERLVHHPLLFVLEAGPRARPAEGRAGRGRPRRRAAELTAL